MQLEALAGLQERTWHPAGCETQQTSSFSKRTFHQAADVLLDDFQGVDGVHEALVVCGDPANLKSFLCRKSNTSTSQSLTPPRSKSASSARHKICQQRQEVAKNLRGCSALRSSMEFRRLEFEVLLNRRHLSARR